MRTHAGQRASIEAPSRWVDRDSLTGPDDAAGWASRCVSCPAHPATGHSTELHATIHAVPALGRPGGDKPAWSFERSLRFLRPPARRPRGVP